VLGREVLSAGSSCRASAAVRGLGKDLQAGKAVPGELSNEPGLGLRAVVADSMNRSAFPAADGEVAWAVIRSRDVHTRRW
jgi:hypothetical protein